MKFKSFVPSDQKRVLKRLVPQSLGAIAVSYSERREPQGKRRSSSEGILRLRRERDIAPSARKGYCAFGAKGILRLRRERDIAPSARKGYCAFGAKGISLVGLGSSLTLTYSKDNSHGLMRKDKKKFYHRNIRWQGFRTISNQECE